MDRIPTVFFGPRQHVRAGDYAEAVDHLTVLATVLDRYGVLESFRREFRAAYRGAEAAVHGLGCAPGPCPSLAELSLSHFHNCRA